MCPAPIPTALGCAVGPSVYRNPERRRAQPSANGFVTICASARRKLNEEARWFPSEFPLVGSQSREMPAVSGQCLDLDRTGARVPEQPAKFAAGGRSALRSPDYYLQNSGKFPSATTCCAYRRVKVTNFKINPVPAAWPAVVAALDEMRIQVEGVFYVHHLQRFLLAREPYPSTAALHEALDWGELTGHLVRVGFEKLRREQGARNKLRPGRQSP